MSRLRDLYESKIGNARPPSATDAYDDAPELLFYVGAEAVLQVLKDAGPDKLVATIWALDLEVTAANREVSAKINAKLGPLDRFSLEMLRAAKRNKNGG